MIITKFARCKWIFLNKETEGYIIRYKVKLNDKLFDTFTLIRTKENVAKFCEENDLTTDDLKKYWSKEKEIIKYLRSKYAICN